ncbi:MAG: hypothetical protein OXH01_08400 [Bacteroidetes bacterium]|nr:hypothetical protein [Bacteroidota bacterium]
MSRFSRRHGYGPQEPEITIRHEAPSWLRSKIVELAYVAGLMFYEILEILSKHFGRISRSAGDPKIEIGVWLNGCEWYDVYDIIEAIYQKLEVSKREYFETKINEVFREKGIGWKLDGGKITYRGEGPFESLSERVPKQLEQAGLTTGGNEFQEATANLSHRPEPKLSDAIDHAYKAVECVMRSICRDDDATLGDLLKHHKEIIPPPLDTAVAKLWGYASQYGRHRAEGKDPQINEAELAIHVAAAVVMYLSKKVDE